MVRWWGILALVVGMPLPKGAIAVPWHGVEVKATASKLRDGRIAVKLSGQQYKSFFVSKIEAVTVNDESSLRARVQRELSLKYSPPDDRTALHTDDRAVLEPSTQSMDTDELDGCRRPESPPTRMDIDDVLCKLCDEAQADAEPAFDLPGGRFCCASCFDSNVGDELIQEAAAQQLQARRSVATQPVPGLPQLQPRRSARPTKPVAQLYDLERAGPGQPG
eukprot:5717648-Prymnesium_polylepis.1